MIDWAGIYSVSISRLTPFLKKQAFDTPDPEEYRLDVGTSDCGAISLKKGHDISLEGSGIQKRVEPIDREDSDRCPGEA
jgi:hypothetical protein